MIDADTSGRQVLSATSRQGRVDPDDDILLDDALPARVPGKSTGVQRAGDGASEPSGVAARIDRRAELDHDVDDGALASAFASIHRADGGSPLPSDLALRFARELGIDVTRVRIHTDDHAAAAAASISARAFTIGNDIYFARGAYDPTSEAGLQLIAHEMAHVAENVRGTAETTRKVSHPDDHHERRADAFARDFGARRSRTFESSDPAELVEHVRSEGRRLQLPFMSELEQHFGQPLDFVETYTGEAAELACRLMAAGAFAVRNVIALADPSPQRETLMHELTHVMQMGGRAAAAPARFAPGSLAVGPAGSDVELEAETHAARPTHGADVNTIHRAGPDKKDAKADPKKLKAFCEDQAPENSDKSKLHWGVKNGAHTNPRYYSASTTAFTEQTFTDNGGTKEILDGAISGGGVIKDVPGFWLHRAGSSYVISRVAKTNPPAYEATVTKVSIEDKDKWKEWLAILTGRKVPSFTWPKAGGGGAGGGGATGGTGGAALDQSDPPTSATEVEEYRDAMRTAVATAWSTKAEPLGTFYKDFVQTTPRFTNKITGTIFEELVALVASDSGADATSAIPVWDKKNKDAAPILKTLKKDRLDGDGVIKVAGGVIAISESKAYAKNGGPTASDKKKMGDYRTLIDGKIPGYVNNDGNIEKVTFNHVAYTIATPPPGSDGKYSADVVATLNKWMKEIGAAFGDPAVTVPAKSAGKYSAKNWSLNPSPDGSYKFKVKFNPELEYEVPAGAKSINIDNPTVAVPGLKVQNIKANVDDSHNLTTGSVTFGIEAADLKKPMETKPLTAGKEAGGGQVDNKLTGLTSKLASYLPVDIDAAIVDDGVEATLKLKQGAVKNLAGFEIDAAEIKVTYKGGGTLNVDTEIGLKHKNGKIGGKIKISYDGGWAFEGKVKISEGFIPGVSELEATVSKSASGEWKIGADTFTIEKQFGAIKLTGTGTDLEYNVTAGTFKGELELKADMGMFGKASGSAKIENNKLTKGKLTYDSPELKYPKDKPVITGTVGGTVRFDDGKFSGDIKGSANLNIASLQKIAKDGVGLDVDAHIDADGGYYGSIKSTKPLTIGKHLQISAVGLTLEKDGSLKGNFEIEIVNIKNIKSAKAKGTVDKSGVHIESASATVEFGNKDGKFWGEITASYSDEKGFDVSGTANYKIKDDIIATGTVKYSQETNAISVELKVTEITLFDKKISKQLFKASKQFPVVNIYGLGIYVDIGFDLGFDFGFKLTMTPSAKVEDFSLETLEFKRIAAKLEVGGDIYAQLTGTPKLGIGVFALDPSILRGGGGLKVPIVGRLDVKPSATFEVGYSPTGGADASAKLGLAGEFGIKGSVKPYAEFSVLNDVWNPKWEGDALAEFEILKPTELFNFTVDLNSKEKQEDPALPGQNETKTPSEPQGDKTAKAAPAAATERGGDGNKSTPAKQGEVAEGGDEGPFSLSGLMKKLESVPGFSTAKKIFEYGQKIWKVVKPIWDLVSPLMDIIVKRIEEVIGLFDPGPSADGLGAWLWKLAKFLFNISFGGITELASAIKTLLGSAAAFAKKLINKAVQDGHIGVKRHSYYIWTPWPADDITFMAASEWKINIPGVADLGQGGPPGFLLTPSGAVALVLYEALGLAGVGYTYTGRSDIGEPYNDRWTGAGARG